MEAAANTSPRDRSARVAGALTRLVLGRLGACCTAGAQNCLPRPAGAVYFRDGFG